MRRMYRYAMPWGDELAFTADLTQASAAIEFEDGDSTPFQTADARHDAKRALRLILDYLGPPFTGDDDVDEIVEAAELVDKEATDV